MSSSFAAQKTVLNSLAKSVSHDLHECRMRYSLGRFSGGGIIIRARRSVILRPCGCPLRNPAGFPAYPSGQGVTAFSFSGCFCLPGRFLHSGVRYSHDRTFFPSGRLPSQAV